MNDELNPYAAPESEPGDLGEVSADAPGIRRRYIAHEASVRSIGYLYYLGAFLMGAAGIFVVAGLLPEELLGGGPADGWILGVIGGMYVGLSVGLVALGNGMRHLRRWTRIPVAILAGLGLLGFPVGTIINGYILYLVFSPKGSMVFSEEYRLVIAQTPEIRYRTSILVWVLLIILVGLVSLLIGGALFSAG